MYSCNVNQEITIVETFWFFSLDSMVFLLPAPETQNFCIRHFFNTSHFPFSFRLFYCFGDVVILLCWEGCKTLYYYFTTARQEAWVAMVRFGIFTLRRMGTRQ